jgi:hypothetical protein
MHSSLLLNDWHRYLPIFPDNRPVQTQFWEWLQCQLAAYDFILHESENIQRLFLLVRLLAATTEGAAICEHGY